ncbi:AIS_HP2_G0019390.mRNA.1.CDS.1 [Saccharomyces cerevisiae]|nr:AIS_HP2_G0019390.mRNA.1.CDS.1 [Saccharomyces cerevisiae]CAI6517884.1 AIS_HP2_G0019390.mRNA.1.CDS.1 [Saccharomyces cerevisiae]
MLYITSNGRRILDKKIRITPTGLASKRRAEMAGHVFKYITVFSVGFFVCREQARCLRAN